LPLAHRQAWDAGASVRCRYGRLGAKWRKGEGKAVIQIAKGDSLAEIAERGAQVTRWCVGGRDLLWSGDGAWWDEQSPLLFPVVGWTREGQSRVNGQTYALGLHGFARRETFVLDAIGGDFVRLGLRDSEATRALYPFAFHLSLTYTVAEAGLTMAAVVANTGSVPMPYAFGFHPGFAWPFAAGSSEGHAVVFDAPERPLVPVIAQGGLIAQTLRPVPLVDGRRLALTSALFAGDALCFIDARSRGLRFEDPLGNAIAMRVENLPHLALWTRPGAPYLCLEPWSGYSDPEGFTGDLFTKPSMTILAAGQTRSHAARFRFEQAAATQGA
jgi:galactose mutarotase-like enzyme